MYYTPIGAFGGKNMIAAVRVVVAIGNVAGFRRVLFILHRKCEPVKTQQL